ncbi:hypothetical protein HMPREF1062_04307 [Bacteroides cellulosilyticus CL02T12C19]|uniref:Apea-like HEPN domain-containing protein n=1 Tax=Bacteroides cellulosilyticus CL02T12C19 TaxID=997874 RepID=I8VHV3_9BACE|nr:hypothetical protein [Bacteroides cellulosilyticus]EIY25965.1 hypothetical protein HMPREF1062_04307 [Bacteroides cellulosilyticus CL02T12C19]
MCNTMQWINRKFSANLTAEAYNILADFLLLWNLFEDRLFENNFTIEKAEHYVNDYIGRFNPDVCNRVFKYFKKRYTDIELGTVSYPLLFEKLNFRANDRKGFVQNMLATESPSLGNKILASIIIIFRYRNNLFHGLKDVTQINDQQSNFVTANKMLRMFIETNIP